MTDNEIIKALNHCIGDSPTCYRCRYDIDTVTVDECMGKLMKDAFALINRQRAEIERYKDVIKILESDVAKTKVDTTKEFAKYLIDNDEDGVIKTIDLPELVCDFLHPVEKVEHDSLCETETYKGGE